MKYITAGSDNTSGFVHKAMRYIAEARDINTVSNITAACHNSTNLIPKFLSDTQTVR